MIRRVGDLFTEHLDLVQKFNTFLPSGYVVEVHGNTLRIHEPDRVFDVVLNPGTQFCR